jgi:hypothetical protein
VRKRKTFPRQRRRIAAPEGYAPNQTALAIALGTTRQTITNAIKRHLNDPRLPGVKRGAEADGRYNIAAWREFLKAIGVTGRRKQEDLAEEHEIRLRRERLRLAREEFEFEQLKERMLPMGEIETGITKIHSGYDSALLAFESRINEQLEGLDYNDRAMVIRREIELLRKIYREANYLQVEFEDEKLD